jgi:hypothetical protein
MTNLVCPSAAVDYQALTLFLNVGGHQREPEHEESQLR